LFFPFATNQHLSATVLYIYSSCFYSYPLLLSILLHFVVLFGVFLVIFMRHWWSFVLLLFKVQYSFFFQTSHHFTTFCKMTSRLEGGWSQVANDWCRLQKIRTKEQTVLHVDNRWLWRHNRRWPLRMVPSY
jgi:hypothetical protein